MCSVLPAIVLKTDPQANHSVAWTLTLGANHDTALEKGP